MRNAEWVLTKSHDALRVPHYANLRFSTEQTGLVWRQGLRYNGSAMPKAFIMIDVIPGTEQRVQQALSKVAGIKMVYQVTGEHDIIAFVDAEPYEEFAVVLSTIRQFNGVRDTDSHLVL